jgi:uncharacterized membrane-anchored protein YhcB (DUF1043 family)
MLALTIDNQQVESYFANSAEKLKKFIENYVSGDNKLFEIFFKLH